MPIEIAKINKRKAQSITYLLGRMEKQGLIIKIRNENKRNTYKVLLTTKGRRASRNVSNLKVFHKIFGSFTEEKRKRFKKYLLELVNNCGFL
jgi:DNA-binding MarR family transcriptional regulator